MDEEVIEAVEQPAPVESEKMIPASRVNDIVKARTHEAAEKARAEAKLEYERKMEQMQNTQQSQQAQPSMGGMQADDMARIRQQIMDQLREEQQKAQADAAQKAYQDEMNGIADSYFKKIDGAVERHPDIREMSAKFKPEAFPQLTFLLAKMDDAPDIVKEFVANPYKIANIDYLARTNPDLAMSELKKLSDSIQANIQAQAGMKSANAPLSQIKPSTVGSDNGAKSIRDLRKSRMLRG